MAHKAVAIPAHLLKPENKLTPEERAEIAENYGVQPLSQNDIAHLQERESEHLARIAAEEKDILENGYKYKRARLFNEIGIGDQLDALWKGLAAYHEGAPLPEEALKMIDKINDIKQSIPKPGGKDEN